ncbi:hypothetical protein PI125_g18394 [Phytophthora idaei]|nr:hypothetical protein PI125_g18394 [Phytophthora idaei]
MAMGSALLKTEQQRVALVTSNLGGRAREWTLAWGTSVDAVFPTWVQLKQQLSRVFALPNQAYRIRSHSLATRHGKKELLDYVHDRRDGGGSSTRAVTLTVFMEGLRTSAARTEVFHVHLTSFEEVEGVVLNTEHKFTSARPGWHAGGAGSSSGPEPVDLSYTDDEESRGPSCGAARQHPSMLHVRNRPTSAGELPSAQPAQGSAEPTRQLVAGKRQLSVALLGKNRVLLSLREAGGNRTQPRRELGSLFRRVCANRACWSFRRT